MKAILTTLIVLFGVFVLLAMILPTVNRQNALLYTHAAVGRLEELRLKALAGDISQAASSLNEAVGDWPTKVPNYGEYSRIYELARAAAIREIISRMRSLSGEDLGADPKLWIEKYSRKDPAQAEKALQPAVTPPGSTISSSTNGITVPFEGKYYIVGSPDIMTNGFYSGATPYNLTGSVDGSAQYTAKSIDTNSWELAMMGRPWALIVRMEGGSVWLRGKDFTNQVELKRR
jgi:hypothetical protein